MFNASKIIKSIQASKEGLTLAEILTQNPELARRSVQRWISMLIKEGKVKATGLGRVRRYHVILNVKSIHEDVFPAYIPLSLDSRDVLDYIKQPLSQRKSVNYQPEFLYSYLPNQTYYLSATLRNQLKKMGTTEQEKQIAGTYGRKILNRLLIDLSWASSQLEGNTYSRLDTMELIEHGKIAENKATIETQMILNHKAAIELLMNNANEIGFNRYTLLNLHSILSENLLPNPFDEGRLRQHAVEIGKSVFHPVDIPQKIPELFDTLLVKASKILDPFEQAFFIMVHLPYLQPFADVNKRTSRLAANLPFIRFNLCPLTFIGVPEPAYTSAILGIYELTRVELLRDLFVWAYEQSCHEYITIKQSLVEPNPLRLRYRKLFISVIHKIVTKPEKNSLEIIKTEVKNSVDDSIQQEVESMIIEELRRLHEGVLARYNLNLTQFQKWQSYVENEGK